MQPSVLVRGLQNGSRCYVYWIGWRQGLGLWADWPEVRKAHTLIYSSTHDFHSSFLHGFIILLAYDLLSILFWLSQCVSKHLPMDNLQEDALQPTIITYGTAISACGGSAEWPFALTLLEDLRGKQIESNAVVQRGSRFMYIFMWYPETVQIHQVKQLRKLFEDQYRSCPVCFESSTSRFRFWYWQCWVCWDRYTSVLHGDTGALALEELAEN